MTPFFKLEERRRNKKEKYKSTKMPIVKNGYTKLKRTAQSALSRSKNAFDDVQAIKFPMSKYCLYDTNPPLASPRMPPSRLGGMRVVGS